MTVTAGATPGSRRDEVLARLAGRLPSHLMARDEESGGLMRALLTAVASELDLLQTDLGDLYDGWFVETCAEWLVPYLADLVGVAELPPDLGAGTTRRAFVANTVSYRRRKGTAAVLEQITRDVTDWPARAVEFYRLLATTAHVNHVYLDRPAVASVRDADRLDLTAAAGAAAVSLAPGLDPLAHTAEVRRIGPRPGRGRGRYGIPALGVFGYPIGIYPVGSPLGPADATGTEGGWSQAGTITTGTATTFRADPLGRVAPLFAVPAADPGIEHLSVERDLPVPLRPRRLLALLTAARAGDLASADLPFGVRVGGGGSAGTELPPERIRVCGLEDLDPAAGPADWQVSVDPRSGGLRAYRGGTEADPGALFVRYAYGGLADVGAGTYDRSDVHDRVLAADRYDGRPGAAAQVAVQAGAAASPLVAGSVADALARATTDWAQPGPSSPAGGTYVISVADSASYTGALAVTVPAATRLVLVAATWPDRILRDGRVLPAQPGVYAPDGLRPHVIGTLTVTGGPGSSVVLDGILLEGDLVVAPGDLGALTVAQSTVTGRIVVGTGPGGTNGDLHVAVVRSVLGGIDLQAPVPTAAFSDTVADGAGAATPVIAGTTVHASFEGCTVLGAVAVGSLDASSCVFTDAVVAEHRQVGCLRYSCTGTGSQTPRRFRCVPADANGTPVPPVFASRDPGSPVYPALAPTCPEPIRLGGEGRSEMGVHHHLNRPLRLAAAAAAIAPYTPVQSQIAILGS